MPRLEVATDLRIAPCTPGLVAELERSVPAGTAEARVAARGHRLVAVGVADDDPRAAALYRRLGYEPTSVTEVLEYDWTDASGESPNAVERTTLLVRRLGK